VILCQDIARYLARIAAHIGAVNVGLNQVAFEQLVEGRPSRNRESLSFCVTKCHKCFLS
jgi:hypothetical protein